MSKLVFGDDGSVHADRAWLWLSSQSWDGTPVDVISAGDPAAALFKLGKQGSGPQFEEWDRPFIRQCFAESGLAGVRYLRTDSDARQALSVHQDALVVIGPRGSGGVKDVFIGTVSEHVVRHSPSPVLIANNAHRVHAAVVCVDQSKCAQGAVSTFTTLPLYRQIEKIFVVGIASVGMYDDRADIERALDEAEATLAGKDVQRILVTEDGSPGSHIVRQTAMLGAELVVMGSSQQTKLRRIAEGSVLEDVLPDTPASVLAIPLIGS